MDFYSFDKNKKKRLALEKIKRQAQKRLQKHEFAVSSLKRVTTVENNLPAPLVLKSICISAAAQTPRKLLIQADLMMENLGIHDSEVIFSPELQKIINHPNFPSWEQIQERCLMDQHKSCLLQPATTFINHENFCKEFLLCKDNESEFEEKHENQFDTVLHCETKVQRSTRKYFEKYEVNNPITVKLPRKGNKNRRWIINSKKTQNQKRTNGLEHGQIQKKLDSKFLVFINRRYSRMIKPAPIANLKSVICKQKFIHIFAKIKPDVKIELKMKLNDKIGYFKKLIQKITSIPYSNFAVIHKKKELNCCRSFSSYRFKNYSTLKIKMQSHRLDYSSFKFTSMVSTTIENFCASMRSNLFIKDFMSMESNNNKCVTFNLRYGDKIELVTYSKIIKVITVQQHAQAMFKLTRLHGLLRWGCIDLKSEKTLEEYCIRQGEIIDLSVPVLGGGKTGLTEDRNNYGVNSAKYQENVSSFEQNFDNLNLNTIVPNCPHLHTDNNITSSSGHSSLRSSDTSEHNDDGWKKSNSNAWKKSDKQIADINLQYLEECRNAQRDGVGSVNDYDSNKSTLSLHINVYEKNIEATVTDAINDKKNDLMNKRKFELVTASVIQNPFEFPRQQTDNIQEPEITQFKASQRLLNPNASKPSGINDDEQNALQTENGTSQCYFFTLQKTRLEMKPRTKESSVSVGCQNKNLKSISEFFRSMNHDDLHSDAEIMLARGCGMFNAKAQYFSKFVICEDHVKELLTKWETSSFKHMMVRNSKGSKKPVCSFPHGYEIDHKDLRPLNPSCVITFEEAKRFMETYNELIHVGLRICPRHKQFIHGLVQPNTSSTEFLSEIDVSESSSLSEEEEEEEEYIEPKKPEPKSETSRAFSKLAKAAGIDRVGLRGPFWNHAADTIRKKASDFHKMVNVVAQQMAPDDPDALLQTLAPKSTNETKLSEQVDHLLCELSECYYNASNYKERTEVLAQMASTFQRSQLLQYIPDLSKNRFTSARRLGQLLKSKWKQPITKTIRVRYNKEYVNFFIEFITSSYVMTGLPFGSKCVKLTSGESLEIANTLRQHRNYVIMKMFEKYKVEVNRTDVILSPSSIYKILNYCTASRKVAMQCVDYFVAASDEAFEAILEIIDELGKRGFVGEKWSKDIRRLLLDYKNYLKTEYRMNIKMKSECLDHCITFGLSDPKNSKFGDPACNALEDGQHDHGMKCDKCVMFPKTVCKISDMLEMLMEENENSSALQEQLTDYKEVVSKNVKAVEELKMHFMRCVFSDMTRTKIIENLEEGEAFVTIDYIMKFIATKHQQTQKDFYGQKGYSWSCSHIFAKIGGKIVQHSIVHLLGYEKQDARTVTTIVRDLLTRLKEWKIKSVSFRADNASCYRSTELLVNIFLIAATLKINVKRFSFSEIQNGKSSADTEGSRLKRCIWDWIDSGKSIETLLDMFKALTQSPIPLCALTVVVAKVVGGDFEEKKALNGISKISDVEFDYFNKELRYWQHYKIGEGETLKIQDYLCVLLKARLEIQQSTTHDPSDNNYLFWRPLNMAANEFQTSAPNAVENIENEETEDVEAEYTEEQMGDGRLVCPTDGCRKSFAKFGNLRKHIFVGKHDFPPEKSTMRDFAVRNYARRIEGLTPKLPEQMELLENTNEDDERKISRGWALRKPAIRTIYTSDMKQFLDHEFKTCQQQGMRIDAKVVQKKMAEIVNDEGKKRFKVTERLNSLQIGRYMSAKINRARENDNVIPNGENDNDIEDEMFLNEPMFNDDFEAIFESIADWSEIIPPGKENGEFDETIECFDSEITDDASSTNVNNAPQTSNRTPLSTAGSMSSPSTSGSRSSKRKSSAETPKSTKSNTVKMPKK